jgi:soluble lytic murein transglycosylase-like protein
MKIATVLFLIAVAIGWHLAEPVPPPVVRFAPLSAEQIQRGVAYDQKEKEYTRAAIAARLVYRRNGCRTTFAEETGRIAVDNGLSARVLAALVFVESSCNPNAASNRDSIGLAQINYHVWKQHTRKEYLNPELNLQVGANILANYVRKYGLREGLHHYNGLGDTSDFYSTKVLTAAGLIS